MHRARAAGNFMLDAGISALLLLLKAARKDTAFYAQDRDLIEQSKMLRQNSNSASAATDSA
jgi:hypothetical protein